jgi:hypothetical protein
MRGAILLLPNTPSWRGAELNAAKTLPFLPHTPLKDFIFSPVLNTFVSTLANCI